MTKKHSIEVKPSPDKTYTKEDLLQMEKPLLRALLRERVHHRIEVPLNAILSSWNGQPKSNFGKQAQMVLEVWKDRGFTQDDPDIEWAERYCSLASKVQSGEEFELGVEEPEPFTEDELNVVDNLIFDRHSIRNWIDKPIPNEILNKILEAGRAAPIGCNLDEIRFVILKTSEEKSMVSSDISTQNATIIVVCYDKRIPEVVGQDKTVPQNAGHDAATAADHMLLMAHALGLGGVWLSESAETEFTSDAGEKFKKEFGLPEYIEVAMHIAVGWAERGTIKSKRMPLENMILTNGKSNS